MNYFFGKPDTSVLKATLLERGWSAADVEIAIIPTITSSSHEVDGGTSINVTISPPVMSLIYGYAILPLKDESPLMLSVGTCLEAYFRLPQAIDQKVAPALADRNNASLIVSAKDLIERHEAFVNAERAAIDYDLKPSSAYFEARLKAEWARFQLTSTFVALPCNEKTFRDIFTANARQKHPLPFLETYSHYWQSKEANLNGEQPSDFAIHVVERCVDAGIKGKWEQDIETEVIRTLRVHPLHTNIFHEYVADLLAAEVVSTDA